MFTNKYLLQIIICFFPLKISLDNKELDKLFLDTC